MMYLLYWGLLFAWVLLLWPAIRLKGAARAWLLFVIAAGLAGLVYEVYMYLWSSASIRLDILLISMALGCLYATTALLLVFKRLRATAALLAFVLALIGSGMSYKWIEVSRETQRVSEVFKETNRLLHQAKFRSPEIYERQFGPFDGAADGDPSGHWQIEGRSHFTRMIINAEGRIWLFYQCQEDAECHSGPKGSGLRKSGTGPGDWNASLKPEVGQPFDIKITRTLPDKLSVEVRDRVHRFSEAPPPFNPMPVATSLRFLGPFSHLECSGSGAHATVRQVWLWEDGARRYAIGIFSTLVAGRQNRHVPVLFLGEGERQRDGWDFSWQRGDRSSTATINDNGRGAILLTLSQDGRDREDADKLVLKRGGIFDDERIELAPLATADDWDHWFKNVLTGHFASADVPGC